MTGVPSTDERSVQARDAPDPRETVRATLAAVSRAWQERRHEALADRFAPDMVFALPGLAGRLERRDAIVESYREFMDRVTVTAYREELAAVDVRGDTAMATFRWEIDWLAGGVPNHAADHDAFLLRRVPAVQAGRSHRWVAVLFPAPAPPAPRRRRQPYLRIWPHGARCPPARGCLPQS